MAEEKANMTYTNVSTIPATTRENPGISSIIVPGAAGPAGINTIKGLHIAGYEGKIVATDSSELAAGFFLADAHAVMPETSNENAFVERLIDLVIKYKVQLLMPSSGYDIYPYGNYRHRLEEYGALPIVSDRDSLEICRDKLLTHTTLYGIFDVPITSTDPFKVVSALRKEKDQGDKSLFPTILAKPRFGKGSRDVIILQNESDLGYVTSKYPEMIFQEFLPGTEYTVDVLSNLEKEPIIAVPRVRLQTKAGISTRGQVVRNSKLEDQCMKIAKHIGIRGPCCIQMKESDEGVLKLVEINPRMGGGTIFTTLAGANFPKMIVDMAEGKKVYAPRLSEITVVRYYEEIIVPNMSNIEDESTTGSNPKTIRKKGGYASTETS
jgi:carbamoyl-phosphate synthase large subunit